MVFNILLSGEKRSKLMGWMLLSNLVELVVFILYCFGGPPSMDRPLPPPCLLCMVA